VALRAWIGFRLDSNGEFQMKHIFISHAGNDSEIAQQLYGDLRNVGHEVRIDLHELKLGDDTIDFMNEGIANAHTNIIIFSHNTPKAKWQKLEINAAVWNETAQAGGKVIVVKVDDAQLPPLLGPRMYGSLAPDSYHATLKKLCEDILPRESATTLVCEALSAGSNNPFWRVRAEYFEEMPALLAQSFSPPDAAKVGILEEMMPCFLEGSRGTGKTMLLLSLRARILASRQKATTSLDKLFGFYVRLDRGAFCNAGIRSANEGAFGDLEPQLLVQLTETFAQEFYLTLLESVLSEVTFCARHRRLTLDAAGEGKLIRGVVTTLFGPEATPPTCLEGLLTSFADMHRRLSEFVRRKFIYGENASIPFAIFDIDLFKRALDEIKVATPDLSETDVAVLLDEYENLFAYQKVVVNTLIKLGPPSFSVKVARKAGTEETSQTTLGQELQESHDYNRIPLVYSVEDDADFARYLDLLDRIVAQLLQSQGLPTSSLASILPTDDGDEVDEGELRHETLKLLKLSQDEFDKLAERQQKDRLTYYREAATYRLLYSKRARRTEKRFAGHRDLAFISSGVIRYFQEIIGMAYHLQASSTTGEQSQLVIAPEHQSRAVYTVSNHSLATLSRNVETHGERLKYFLLDLGDCLRHKLLHHTSEPEAGRIAIKDPQSLKSDAYAELDMILNLGVKEGVFQTIDGRPGMRPKHVDDPQPVEINIARIFAPVLQFSPRLRWPTPVGCSDLRGLLDPSKRRSTKARLLKKLAKTASADADRPLLRRGGIE